MRGWAWWVAVPVLGFVACGESSSNDDDTPSKGGTAGTPASGGASGSSRGGASPTGGRGGQTGGDSPGGSAGAGGSEGGTGGVAGSEAGTGGDAGGGGTSTCDLAGGYTCSFEATCDELGCGLAWSVYDERLCHRTSCDETGTCPSGHRCVAAPVAGRFSDPCRLEADSCDPSGATCECILYEECLPSVNCLPVDQFPAEDDCPIADLDCGELEVAAMTLEAYLDGSVFMFSYDVPANVASSVQACADAVEARLDAECD